MDPLFLRRPLAGEAVFFGAVFLLVFDFTTRLRRGVCVFEAAIVLFDLRFALLFVLLEGMAAVYHQCTRTGPMPGDPALNIAQDPAARKLHMVSTPNFSSVSAGFIDWLSMYTLVPSFLASAAVFEPRPIATGGRTHWCCRFMSTTGLGHLTLDGHRVGVRAASDSCDPLPESEDH